MSEAPPAGEPAPPPDALQTILLIVAFVIGGAVLGLGIAYGLAGGTPLAVFVGFMALPVAFGLALGAWRATVTSMLLAGMTRGLLRSNGDWDTFRSEVGRSLGVRTDPSQPAVMPGTWVILPVTATVGIVAALLMAVFGAGNSVVAGAVLLTAAIGMGIVIRRMARSGRLLVPSE